MYVLNQNQKNFITSSKIKKLMAVLDISAEDLCKNTGIDFHDFSEALMAIRNLISTNGKPYFIP